MPRLTAELWVFIDRADVGLRVRPVRCDPPTRAFRFSASSDGSRRAVCEVTQDGDGTRCTCPGRSARCAHIRMLRSVGLIR